MKRHFSVVGCFDHANKRQRATLTVNAQADLVTLRIHRRHKTYEFSLTGLAEITYRKAVEQEVREKQKPRKKLAHRGLLSTMR